MIFNLIQNRVLIFVSQNSEVYLRHVPETLNRMDARLVAARLPGFAMYGSPYSAPNFPGYLSYGPAAAAVAAATDPAAFYSQMVRDNCKIVCYINFIS